jgi:tRNA-(ms[2]io[6]A)-hydroxylase
MDYPQILSPIINFLHCPTPQAWIDEARKPENLPLLLTDHMVCELKAAQNAMLLVRRYVADKADADELLACLKPYEDFTYRRGPEPDFVALHKRINKSAMPQTDDPWGRQLLDSMILLIKEELHHFWQVREMMLARDIPYVKITASNYARGMRREVRSHEPVMLIDKLICGAYIEARSCERFARWRRGWTTICRSSICRCCAPKRVTIRTIWIWRRRLPEKISASGCASSARRKRR